MNTQHTYFQSGPYRLPAHLDFPPEGVEISQAIVFVPPFGWEDICSYRPLRWVAKMLASHGIAVLRFDLPGTGDSSGDACDHGLVEHWIHSIGDAAETLKHMAGVTSVSVFGVRLGAMLALQAAVCGSAFESLILWAPTSSGHSLLREMRACRNLESIEYADGELPPPQSLSGLETAGFFVNPETESHLRTLDFSTFVTPNVRRILLLSRDRMAQDRKLVSAFEATGIQLEQQEGLGFAEMTALPDEVVPPSETALLIVDFLRREQKSQPAEITVSHVSKPLALTTGTESLWARNRYFGVFTRSRSPGANSDYCVVFLNAGGVRHVGPNRLWVEAARRWASQGISSLRVDLQGIGESEGEQNLTIAELYQDRMVDQAAEALSSLATELGPRRFVAVGLCAGAFWSFHLALRYPKVVGAILLNPRLFFWDPEIDRKRARRRSVQAVIKPAMWKRLVQGDISGARVRQAAGAAISKLRFSAVDRCHVHPTALQDAWETFRRKDARVSIIFTEGEPLLQELEQEGQMPPEFVRIVRVRNTGHTFRTLWAQQKAHDLLDRQLDAILNASNPQPGTETLALAD